MTECLISHIQSSIDMEFLLRETRERIQREGDKEYVSVEEQLTLLDELMQSEVGRFFLKNKGANGYWIHYLLMYPWRRTQEKSSLKVEQFIFERAPLSLATQERFTIFLKESQKSVKEGACLASIPSGLLGELLYLDLEKINNIQLVGIDYDEETLRDANALAKEKGLDRFVELHQSDAWALRWENAFDLISSNGLNIYEPDHDKVTALYQGFYKALKPGGKLVTSFVTAPPQLTDACEWKVDLIDPEDLRMNRILYSDIIGARWQCFRSSQETKEQLESVGFQEVEFIYDKAHLYPTVVAWKG